HRSTACRNHGWIDRLGTHEGTATVPAQPKSAAPHHAVGPERTRASDRHRFLHTSGLWLTDESRVIFDPPGGGTVEYSIDLPGPLEHGAVVASGRLVRTADQPEVSVQIVGVPDLVIESLTDFRGDPNTRGIYVRGLYGLVGYV